MARPVFAQSGGGTTLTASGVEKVYVVTEGEVEVTTARGGDVRVEVLGFPTYLDKVGPIESRDQLRTLEVLLHGSN